MTYDFDNEINRYGTSSVKWDMADSYFNTPEVLPLWVADMDFKIAPEIQNALEERLAHGIFGYTYCEDSYYQAIQGWMRSRHDWEIEKSWILSCPGVIPALHMIVQTYTEPGDSVIIQEPVYYYFAKSVTNNGRIALNNELVYSGGRYSIDFTDFEEKARDPKCKMVILCSPHNPVGRVWTRDELLRLSKICLEHGLIIVSDEIHHDLVLKGTHYPTAGLFKEIGGQTITCTAPSKTFNLAGLHTANVIIENNNLRNKFRRKLSTLGFLGPNTFAITALEAAYTKGAPWLEALLGYVKENLVYLKTYLQKHLPYVKIIEPEATYLVWLDFSSLAGSERELRENILTKGNLALDDGILFGKKSALFQRINIACPRRTLAAALDRIVEVFQ